MWDDVWTLSRSFSVARHGVIIGTSFGYAVKSCMQPGAALIMVLHDYDVRKHPRKLQNIGA